MAFDPVTYAAAVGKSNKYTDYVISQLPNGIVYRGAVNYYNNLPNDAEIGDAYTVKYEGTSGTTPSGQEYVWGEYENVEQWISIGPDLSQYQPLLVSGQNIKSINGESILGSGDMRIVTNQEFPQGWPTTGTTKAFCDTVNADATATQGMSFLGEVTWSDFPTGIANAEVVVQIMDGTGTSNKVIHLTLTSGNVNPYRWEYTYWNNGLNVSGWVAFETQNNKVTSISSASTDAQYPSAKAVYDELQLKQNTIDSTHKLSSDLVDDTNNTNKFVRVGSNGQILGTDNNQLIWIDEMTNADIDLAISAELITTTVTNGTATGDSVIAGTATVTIVPNEGYALPSSVTVVGATSSYDDSTGIISLSSATGEVSITAACVAVYSITASVTNGSYSGATQISTTASGTLSANQGYVLPSSITVTGATLDSYDSSTGAVSISAPTGNVTITCVCEASGGGLPTPKASLADYTLEEIQQLSEALVDNTISKSDLSSTYHISVGDTMAITAAINNETHSYRLMAVNHDIDINGNYAGMTFKQVDLMANAYAMKSSMSSTDSWQNSDLKTTLEGFTVNPALAAVIKPVKKVCAASVSYGTPTYNYINTTNGLFIESETEVFGTQTRTIGGTVEGSRYEWYANGGSTVMQRNGVNAWWWLRSPGFWDDGVVESRFAVVNLYGGVSNYRSGSSGGVAPCFCI